MTSGLIQHKNEWLSHPILWISYQSETENTHTDKKSPCAPRSGVVSTLCVPVHLHVATLDQEQFNEWCIPTSREVENLYTVLRMVWLLDTIEVQQPCQNVFQVNVNSRQPTHLLRHRMAFLSRIFYHHFGFPNQIFRLNHRPNLHIRKALVVIAFASDPDNRTRAISHLDSWWISSVNM